MTRHQRDKSQSRFKLEADLGRFVDNPVRLSADQTQALLNELCVDFGVCLTPQDSETVEADPPQDPRAFAELVMDLEGLGSDDPEIFLPVLERVLRTFDGIAPGQIAVARRKQLRAEEVAGVLRADAAGRYSHFITQVADWGEVWSLRHADGWVSVSDMSEVPMLPVWPHETYARLMAVDAWSSAVPAPIDVHDWIEKWASGLAADGSKVAVFPTPEMKGVVADPGRLAADLQAELDRLK